MVKLRGAGRVSAAGLFLHVLVVPVLVVDVVAVAVAVLVVALAELLLLPQLFSLQLAEFVDAIV